MTRESVLFPAKLIFQAENVLDGDFWTWCVSEKPLEADAPPKFPWVFKLKKKRNTKGLDLFSDIWSVGRNFFICAMFVKFLFLDENLTGNGCFLHVLSKTTPMKWCEPGARNNAITNKCHTPHTLWTSTSLKFHLDTQNSHTLKRSYLFQKDGRFKTHLKDSEVFEATHLKNMLVKLEIFPK